MKASFEFESAEDFVSLLNYRSMEDLLSCIRAGWEPGIKVINELLDEMSLNIEFKQDIAPAVQGLFFDIGLVCSDIPEHWFAPQPIGRGQFNNPDPLEGEAPIQIGVNLGGLLSQASAIEKGAAIAVLIMYLIERLKRPVMLKQFYGFETTTKSFLGSALIKKEDEELNIEALSFWLCCPKVENLWTRIIEDTPCLREAVSLDQKNKFKPNVQYGKQGMDIFISTNSEKENWTREDSKSWIASTLSLFGVNSQPNN